MSESSSSTSPSMTDFLPLQHDTINPIKKTCKSQISKITFTEGQQMENWMAVWLCKFQWCLSQDQNTYCNECPVPEVIDSTEEPKFMKKKVCTSNNTLI